MRGAGVNTPSFFSILGRPDPTPWILESDEPQARWVALAELLPDLSKSKRAAGLEAAHVAVLAHPATRALLDFLPAGWDTPADASGHNKPELATNLLALLADIGLTEADDPRIGRLLDGMLARTDAEGRFLAHGVQRSGPPVWGCLPCDTHAIADILGRFGRTQDPRWRRALSAAESDLARTDFGLTWRCRPDAATGFRGPGRADEPCPQTTLEALRAFSWLPPAKRPAWLPEVVHASLEVWRRRGDRKPYMFGHGRQFKIMKWPPAWYGAYEVVDVLGRLPEAWRDRPKDRRSVAEIAACLVAYNIAPDGRVTPQSTFKGWEMLSLGRKKEPSPLATTLVWSRLARFADIAGEIAAVDVLRLGSSKGGSGAPLPPRLG
jgi:hypothetical protein